MSHLPNVVVFVLDSVRYDHTSVSGYYRNTTPNIQRIADQDDGISFNTAISHAKHTPKSVASILTGKYPAEHRINYESNTLDSSIPTVAEAFRNEGYATACVSNNSWVSPETGLTRGFDEATLLPKTPLQILRSVGIYDTARFLVNIRKHSAGFQRDIQRHSGAYLTTSLVSQQLARLAERSDPFFLYVHYNEPHRAYYPPLDLFDTYSDSFKMPLRDAGEFSMDVHYNLNEKVANGCPFTKDQWAVLKALYDTEIYYTDTFVGDLFDQIQQQFNDTIVIVTSDHGEHFGERGALAHRYVLDDALLHVPLVTSGLDVAETNSPVQHSDVMRTVLEIIGADAEFVDGVDLRNETREFAISQDGESSIKPLLEHNADFDGEQFFPGADTLLPERTALRTESHRYVRGVDGTEILFQIPNEAQGDDLSEDEPDIMTGLKSRLDTWFKDHKAAQPGGSSKIGREFSEATKARLKQMGYLEEDF